jgi:tetratricopeptide (TPR) repeat protein
MGLKTACIALLALLVPVYVAWSAEIGGKYLVAGTNLDGSKYAGTADITIGSDTDCHIVWHSGGQDLSGICMRGPESVVAGYADQNGAGLVFYKIEADGTLNGVWTADAQKGVGTDVLTPERLTSSRGATTPAIPSQGPSDKANDVPASAATSAEGAAKSDASPASPSEPSSNAMSDPSFRGCVRMTGHAGITTCTAAIDSDDYSGSDLAHLYAYRGSDEAESDSGQAERDYNRAIDLDPNLALAFNGRGMLFYDRNEYDRAIQDFNRAIDLNDKSAAAFDNRGITYFDMKDSDHAKADFDRAIELDPKDLDAYWNRGDLYRSKGDRENAAADYRMALSLGPNDDDKKEIEAALNGLGTGAPAAPAATQGSAPAPGATRSNERQAAPAPAAANAASDEGASADVNNNPDYKACIGHTDDAALAACTRAIGSGALKHLELALVYVSRSNQHVSRSEIDLALDDANRAVEAGPDLGAAFNIRCFVLQQKGDLDQALKDCDRAVTLKPDDAVYHYLRGRTYQAEGDRDQASSDYKTALTLNPDDSLKKKIQTQLDQLGSAKENNESDSGKSAAPEDNISHGDGSASASNPDPDYQACRNASGDEAIAACDQVIGSGKFGDPELALAYNRRGYMHWGKGDFRRALDDENKAIELDPEFARAYSDRGMVYFAKRDYRHALADFNKSIQIDPKFSLAYSNRGATYERRKEYDQAITDFDVAIALNPNLALAYYNRGTVYEAMGRRYNAILDYRRALERDPDDQDIKAALKKLGASATENVQ